MRAFWSFRSFYRLTGFASVFTAGGVLCFRSFTVFAEVPRHAEMQNFDPKDWMTTSITPWKVLEKELDTSYRAKMEALCLQLQGKLCREMERVDGKAKFLVDKWDRKAGGGGITCVMEDGAVFEKAGVNISAIHGTLSPAAVREMRARHSEIDVDKDCKFFACGISSVIHPRNPYVPTTHFNFRYFEVDLGQGRKCWWYGGGSDLTPFYLFEEDAKHFHQQLKAACDKHNPTYYGKFKKWCDEYFYLKHRGETRGIGGIFFDDLEGESHEKTFEFVRSCAEAIIPAYIPIVEKRHKMRYVNSEREWQLVRRGRYVEFNLVYDRGTKFGLATPEARIESILMSLPLYASWVYCYDTTKDPRNQQLLDVLVKPREWV
ncbi:Oxygen-dependent coproporphyrinogen-III oxidase [Fasciola hepatica]|uniref:coproporphyrinogen oxidase n=1 Tax=Fasciola hepatica TaxID=6192 RepID=A0A4E0R836_FASHE|nr:Oxygen-dependent coproporphyrinogen-III oxidase [Fasciola hepatica]